MNVTFKSPLKKGGNFCVLLFVHFLLSFSSDWLQAFYASWKKYSISVLYCYLNEWEISEKLQGYSVQDLFSLFLLENSKATVLMLNEENLLKFMWSFSRAWSVPDLRHGHNIWKTFKFVTYKIFLGESVNVRIKPL